MKPQTVSVPSFGDSFFMLLENEPLKNIWEWFPSPHSGILFLFRPTFSGKYSVRIEFPSPHSGILFLLNAAAFMFDGNGGNPFPSPHSGILFLFPIFRREIPCQGKCFRPLIRGFFFYREITNYLIEQKVSVPSFGDSFFMFEVNGKRKLRRPMDQVSVPSFGDSFFILI